MKKFTVTLENTYKNGGIDMKNTEKIIEALKLFPGWATIVYGDHPDDTVTYQDIIDYIVNLQNSKVEAINDNCHWIEQWQAKVEENDELQEEIERLKGVKNEYSLGYADGYGQARMEDYYDNAKIQKQAEAWKLRSKELEEAWEVSSSNEEKLQKKVDEFEDVFGNADNFARIMSDLRMSNGNRISTSKELLEFVKQKTQYAYDDGYKRAVKDVAERFANELEYESVYFDMSDGYIYKAAHIEDIYNY